MTPSRSELQQHIAQAAELFGWHLHRSRRPALAADGYPDGFPNEVLIRDGRLVFIALASRSGRLSRRETRWLDELGSARSVETHVFRPQELAQVSAALRPRPTSVEEQAPPRRKRRASNKDVRPTARGGRQEQSSQAPTSKEEACEGPAAS